MTELSVVIPAYQEAENLRELLPILVATLRGMSIDYEVLVVDSQEPLDETEAVCRDHAADGVRHMRRREGPTMGSAYRLGIAASTGQFVIFMDGDGSHDPKFVTKLFAKRKEADVVVASRYTEGGSTENTWLQRRMSWMVNITYRVVFSLDCKDVSNSFKLYPGDALRRLSLVSNNFDIIEEMLIKLQRSIGHLAILEIPFYFSNRRHGTTKRRSLPFIIYAFGASIFRLKFMK